MKLLDIGELSERTSLPPSALRYYEEKGLIKSVARRGLRRQYDADALLHLALISLAKTAGFSLSEIARMFGRDGRPNIARATLRQRAESVDRQIQELTLLRNALRHVAECPRPSQLECPRFRKLMRVAQRYRTQRP
jgi:DNA-binding transcriptional MerR regulator